MRRRPRFLLYIAVLSMMASPFSCTQTEYVDNVSGDVYVAPGTSGASEDDTTDGIDVTEAVTEGTVAETTEPAGEKSTFPPEYRLEVESILQKPELPSGCEVTSLAVVLNYYGFVVDKVELSDKYLIKSSRADVTFDDAYVGDPKTNGFCCYAPVIVRTAEKYFRENIITEYVAEDLTGTGFEELFYEVYNGRPVIVWSSISMSRDPSFVYKWTTPDGTKVFFDSYEHCVVLTGYDKNNGLVFVADPLRGNVEYPLGRFSEIYDLMGMRAVVIKEEENRT